MDWRYKANRLVPLADTLRGHGISATWLHLNDTQAPALSSLSPAIDDEASCQLLVLSQQPRQTRHREECQHFMMQRVAHTRL
jgi:hypothetical protein